MRIATLISSIISILLLLTTMICGLWIRANSITDPSSVDFHVASGIASVVFLFLTFIMMFSLLARMKERG
ncbi:MAG: hypothetical protein K0R57_413 [Paenibacillaceae bacterium]|jgi:uncharacterized BrkB/YihY/UPF0761 family membrane protein|nr:hypothetical protein [Paenibacillaceae bacterium]